MTATLIFFFFAGGGTPSDVLTIQMVDDQIGTITMRELELVGPALCHEGIS